MRPRALSSSRAVLVFALLALELACIYVLGRRVLDRLVARAVLGGRLRRWSTWAFLAPGVALHEASHAATATALLGRVTRFVPFRPRATADGGVLLGEVRYHANRNPLLGGPHGRALVGIAPLILVPAVVYVAGCALVRGVAVGDDPSRLPDALFGSSPTVGAIVWGLVALSAGVGLLPSPIDHKDLPAALAILAVLAGLWLLWRGGIRSGDGHELVTGAADPAAFLAQLLAVPAAVALVGSVLLRR